MIVGPELRSIQRVDDDASMRAFARCTSRTFGVPGYDLDAAVAVWDATREVVQRYSLVRDGEVAGTFADWPMAQSLPGAVDLDAWAVSAVTTSLTARRQGVLSAHMTAHRDRVLEAGAQGSVLLAAEWPIYGRFGFGPASDYCDWELDARHARLNPAVVDAVAKSGVVVAHEEAADVWPEAEAVFAATRRGVLGDVERSWPRAFERDFGCGLAPAFGSRWAGWVLTARAPGNGELLGWVRYSSPDAFPETGKATTVIDDMWAPRSEAYAALWRSLLDIDLVSTIKASCRPVNEPVRRLLADARDFRPTLVDDYSWTRLWRVAPVLESVVPAVRGEVVLDVRDTWIDGTVGTAAGLYRWSGEPEAGTSSCGRISRSHDGGEADCSLSVADLASVLFGYITISDLAFAGRVDEGRVGGLDRAGAMFGRSATPWTSSHF